MECYKRNTYINFKGSVHLTFTSKTSNDKSMHVYLGLDSLTLLHVSRIIL